MRVPELASERFDRVVWLGDLNYRISSEQLDRDAVEAHIREGRLQALLLADELNAERAAGRTFVGFEEGTINFPPTYKFDVGTETCEAQGTTRR